MDTEPKRCDDQVALNLAVYEDIFNTDPDDKNSTLIITYEQGEGSINNVGWGAEVYCDKRNRFLNNNCFPSPVVHQFDVADDPEITQDE